MQRPDFRTVSLAIAAYAAVTGIALIDSLYRSPLASRSTHASTSAPPAPARAAVVVTPGLTIPVKGVGPLALTRQFDEQRSGGRRHRAIDIRAARGTPVLAADDGSIARLAANHLGGLTIYQFDRARRRVYYYAHLQRYAPGLAEGAAVRRGEVIGYVGTSGNAPEHAPHLHFAVMAVGSDDAWWEGTPLDPYDLLIAAAPRRVAASD